MAYQRATATAGPTYALLSGQKAHRVRLLHRERHIVFGCYDAIDSSQVYVFFGNANAAAENPWKTQFLPFYARRCRCCCDADADVRSVFFADDKLLWLLSAGI
jgi:hypothetical protein